jgi:Cu(I)/Ag(I) efflux system membrane fusion protein
MDLIPLEKDVGSEDADPTLFRMSKAAKALARIETALVERREVTREVRMVGKVAYDETRVQEITARFPGRLDRLYVDYTGVPVKLQDHLAYIYSPELLTAQQELLQAIQATRNIQGSRGSFLKRTTEATVKASREKLRLWGLTAEQVRRIERSGKPSDHLTLYAYQSGIVVKKHAVEGAYVKEGSKIYTIADLSQVWVNLDAYESDISWIRYGQEVRFETEAYPGEIFEGRIAFVHPVMDERTRTIKLRVNVPNLQGRLKPGMFVRARVQARLMGKGAIFDRILAGKWISPMHPEIIQDAPGLCPICNMPLVKAETLGFVGKPVEQDLPLVIPASAALRTGKRALVYIEVPGRDQPTYQGKVVTLGPRAGDDYIVLSGLKEGERVVVRGNFKIDSAVQILAGPSMMTLPSEGEEPNTDLTGTPFSQEVSKLSPLVGKVAEALQGEDPDGASEAFEALSKVAQDISTRNLDTGATRHAKVVRKSLVESAQVGSEAWEVADQQEAFFQFVKTLRMALPPSRLNDEDHALLAQIQGFEQELAARLADDDLNGAQALLTNTALIRLLPPKKESSHEFALDRWQLLLILRRLETGETLEGFRKDFALLSDEVVTLARRVPELGNGGRFLYCPMAFDGRGANWLQKDGPVANPYFGSAMRGCGEDLDLQAQVK